MTETPYSIFVRGINTLPTIDANSEVSTTGATDSLPTSLSTPSEANGWLKVGVFGLSMGDTDKGSAYTGLGRAEVNDPRVFETFSIRTGELLHPTDAADYAALRTELRKRFVVIATDDYDVTFHAANRAVVCSRTAEFEHSYEQGSKTIIMNLQRVKPYA